MADTREIWVDIKNYEGKYKISNLGRVKSLERQVSHDGITWTQPERIMCHWCGTTSLYDCVRLYKGGLGIDLFLAGTGTAARSIRTGCRKFPHGIFDGITEKFAVDGQVAYGIGLTFEFAVECQLHTSILFVSKE